MQSTDPKRREDHGVVDEGLTGRQIRHEALLVSTISNSQTL